MSDSAKQVLPEGVLHVVDAGCFRRKTEREIEEEKEEEAEDERLRDPWDIEAHERLRKQLEAKFGISLPPWTPISYPKPRGLELGATRRKE